MRTSTPLDRLSLSIDEIGALRVLCFGLQVDSMDDISVDAGIRSLVARDLLQRRGSDEDLVVAEPVARAVEVAVNASRQVMLARFAPGRSHAARIVADGAYLQFEEERTAGVVDIARQDRSCLAEVIGALFPLASRDPAEEASLELGVERGDDGRISGVHWPVGWSSPILGSAVGVETRDGVVDAISWAEVGSALWVFEEEKPASVRAVPVGSADLCHRVETLIQRVLDDGSESRTGEVVTS